MLKSYLTSAWRNIRKNKVFSFINVIGLSIGMAACLLILQYVNLELSYDQFDKNIGEIYRVSNDRYQNGKLIQHGTITYSGIGQALQHDYPEVVNHTRMEPFGKLTIVNGTKKYGEQSVIAVDNSFLTMFSYPLVAGDVRTALTEPHTAVLTEDAASRYYGLRSDNLTSAIGKTFILGVDPTPFKVTGICKSVPENSHLSFDMLTSYITIYTGPYPYKQADYDFTQSNFWHYIQLKKGTDYHTLEAKLPAFSQKYFQGDKISGSVEKFYLQPLSRAHLYSDFEYEIGNTGSATVVWGLLIIASFIIIIAWVNYVNLSTARSVERAREVGVRKVIGAEKMQLVKQFLMESLLINLIAVTLALIFMILLQPLFNTLIGHQLSYRYLLEKSMGGYSVTIGLLVLLLTGIFVSGFYPAFILSSFRPILVLKGRFSTSKRSIALRKALVVGQFAITVLLIIGSIVVYKQIRYMNQQELGMNINRMLVVQPPYLANFDSSFMVHENGLVQQLSQISGVQGASTSWNPMGGETGRDFDVHRADQPASTHYTMRQNGITAGFLKLYQIRLIAGRDYIYSDYNADFNKLHNIILNESAVRLLGYSSPRDAIGQSIIDGGKKWDIIGVINDYHQKSLRYAVEPTLLFPAYSNSSVISVKVNTRDLTGTLATIKKTFESFFPADYFGYFFLDDRFNQQYANDRLFGKAFSIFAGFAIFIACLGLLGLSLFATAQRTKEIGVRKVLGASVGSIVTLLSKDFIVLVLVAFVIASPLAWFLMHQWLQDFAYRTSIEWWVFFVAGLLAAFIALATISIQAIRAAVTNPVKSLRSE